MRTRTSRPLLRILIGCRVGIFDWLFGRNRKTPPAPPRRFDLNELARRLKLAPQALSGVRPTYHQFTIPKRSGGQRTINAPDPQLKKLQRLILRRLLTRLAAHPAATGFERGHSIVTNALPHAGKAIILKLDIRDFFPSIPAERVEACFRFIGWDEQSATILTRLCTHDGSLPQGAPTSPRLSNLVNRRLDERLDAIARQMNCAYTRYADDITFSSDSDPPASHVRKGRINGLIFLTKRILAEEGFTLHLRKKLQIRRRHQRQEVTGLVVNSAPALPRATRRWLRAVEHHAATNRPITIGPIQLQGWRALKNMIVQQIAAE